MIRYSLLTIFIFLILMVSCSSNSARNLGPETTTSIEANNSSDSILEKISDEGFRKLVSHFEFAKLPFYLGLDSPHIEKFDLSQYLTLEERYEKARVPIDVAIKYFLRGDQELNKKPSGGIYEFYYGYCLPSNGNYVLLLYCKSSIETYPYRLATFDYNGNLIDDIGITGGLGQFDPEAIKESVINEDWTINIEEIQLDYNQMTSENGIDMIGVDRVDYKYQITETGNFKEVSKKDVGSFNYLYKEMSDGRTKLCAPEDILSLFNK